MNVAADAEDAHSQWKKTNKRGKVTEDEQEGEHYELEKKRMRKRRIMWRRGAKVHAWLSSLSELSPEQLPSICSSDCH